MRQNVAGKVRQNVAAIKFFGAFGAGTMTSAFGLRLTRSLRSLEVLIEVPARF
jgi:hypothetical protein